MDRMAVECSALRQIAPCVLVGFAWHLPGVFLAFRACLGYNRLFTRTGDTLPQAQLTLYCNDSGAVCGLAHIAKNPGCHLIFCFICRFISR